MKKSDSSAMKFVRTIRECTGLSASELASATGIARVTIKSCANGTRQLSDGLKYRLGLATGASFVARKGKRTTAKWRQDADYDREAFHQWRKFQDDTEANWNSEALPVKTRILLRAANRRRKSLVARYLLWKSLQDIAAQLGLEDEMSVIHQETMTSLQEDAAKLRDQKADVSHIEKFLDAMSESAKDFDDILEGFIKAYF